MYILLLFVDLASVTAVFAAVVTGNADDCLVLRSGAVNCCGIEKIDFVGVVVVVGRVFVIVDCVDDAGTVPVTPNRNDGAADGIVGSVALGSSKAAYVRVKLLVCCCSDNCQMAT